MNIKKGFPAVLAAVTAATSISALTVSAYPFGMSDGNGPVTVSIKNGKMSSDALAVIDGGRGKKIHIQALFPDNAPDGKYIFTASVIADIDTETAFDAVIPNYIRDVIEVTVTDTNGNQVDFFDNIKISVSSKLIDPTAKTTSTGANNSYLTSITNIFYNKTYGTDGYNFKELDTVIKNNVITFVSSGYTKFVLAHVYDTTMPVDSDITSPIPTNPPVKPKPENPDSENPTSETSNTETSTTETSIPETSTSETSNTENSNPEPVSSEPENSKHEDSIPVSDTSGQQPSYLPAPSTPAALTGDNTAAAVFAIIAAAALGTIFAAARIKKSSK